MPRKKSSSNYFTKETEDYIVKYNNSIDQEYRNKIFTEHIYFPFYKLCENIIHTFKFYYTDVEKIEDLKHELVAVLLEEKIDKFDPTNGAKAYSYFGTIVKRWLIAYNNTNYKNLKRITDFSTLQEYYEEDLEDREAEQNKLKQLVGEFIEHCYDNFEHYFSEEDQKIAAAVLTLFENRRELEIFKKKALYIFVREMTDCSTPQLTKVVGQLKTIFYSYKEKKYYSQ